MTVLPRKARHPQRRKETGTCTFRINHLFAMNALKRRLTHGVHLGPIRCACLAPGGRCVVSLGEDDGIPFVLDRDTLDAAPGFDLTALSTAMVRAVAACPRGAFLVAAEDGDNEIRRVDWPECSGAVCIARAESRPGLVAVSCDGGRVAYTGDDPMVCVVGGDGGGEPVMLADNESEVLFLGFSPDGRLLASADSAELYVYACSGFECVRSARVRARRAGVCWAGSEHLIVADSDAKGALRVLAPEEDAEERLRIDAHRSSVVAVAVSESGLLASIDEAKTVVVSRFDRYVETKELPVIAAFSSGIEAEVCVVFWAGNSLYVGTDDGAYVAFEEVDVEGAKEIPVVRKVLESDEEIEEYGDSDEADGAKRYRTLYRREPVESERMGKSNLSEYEEEEEEEEENDERRNRYRGGKLKASSFAIDEADESEYYSEENYEARNRPKEEREEKLNESDEDNFKKLTKRFNKEDTLSESDDDETSETESAEERYVDKNERKERRLDKQFVVGSENEHEESSSYEEEEEEERFDERYQFSDDVYEKTENELYQFMPGSSKDIVNKRRFLCWNLIGTIFLRENVEEGTSIDIEFADKVKYKDKHFNNKEKFILGSLSSGGIVLASRSNISFQSFQKWANDNEFSMRFPIGETIDLVACGDDWFAAATNTLRIHIFLSSGFEIAVLSLSKRLTTMIGNGNLLAIVYGEENELKLFDIKKRKLIAKCGLPFRSELEWIGFDQNTLYIIGKDNQLYGLLFDFGAHWTPLCDIQNKIFGKYSRFWPIGVGNGCIWGIGLEEDQNTPLTISHQKLKGYDIEPVSIDDSTKEYLFRRFEYCNAIDKEKAGTKLDKELLSLFAEAEEMKFYEKMFQIGTEMKSSKGRMFAIQYANSKGVTEIADKLQEFYDETKEVEEEEINEVENDNIIKADKKQINNNNQTEEEEPDESFKVDHNYQSDETNSPDNHVTKTEEKDESDEDSTREDVNEENRNHHDKDSSNNDDDDSVCEDSIGE